MRDPFRQLFLANIGLANHFFFFNWGSFFIYIILRYFYWKIMINVVSPLVVRHLSEANPSGDAIIKVYHSLSLSLSLSFFIYIILRYFYWKIMINVVSPLVVRHLSEANPSGVAIIKVHHSLSLSLSLSLIFFIYNFKILLLKNHDQCGFATSCEAFKWS